MIALLDYVSQLVRHQSPARFSLRRVIPRAEDYVAPDCVSHRIDRLRRLSGVGVSMHPHLAEIAPEARLEESSHRDWQWLATASHGVDWLPLDSFILALRALPLKTGNLRQPGWLHSGRRLIRHPHHLISHPISFLFIRISRLVDTKFGLKKLSRGSIAGGALKLSERVE